ncbi:MAG: ribulose-phosphate 3-epimerase [Ruminococcus sp.]|nr:ribulose-phosphate 3-epimerase [Ruminococcus sp.]
MKNLVSASVLSADMLNLENELRKMEKSGIDMLHFDVMDGVFVNNISFGLPVLAGIKKATDMTLDVHLMITDPLKYVKRFADSGADIISFHIESESDTMETINAIRECGVKTALAVKPGTPAEAVYEYLPYLDMVLVMTVEPGFGGQSFMSDMTEKVRLIRKKITELGLSTDIEVDGGIDAVTSAVIKEAGANVLVSGSYLFKAPDMAQAAEKLREDI